jgi:p-hydroxybenzoate 3-monooxygenase
VLEARTVALLDQLGLAQRLRAEGIVEDSFCLADGERLIRIDVQELTCEAMTVYGQTEVTRDLMDAAPSRGLEIIYEASDVALHDIESDAPYLTYGEGQRIDARFCSAAKPPRRRAKSAGCWGSRARTWCRCSAGSKPQA